MKAKLFAVMALASVALISCQNDDYEFENNRPAKPGDEIVFGGTMEYKSTRTDVTRTVYGDKGSTGTEIKWYEGDMVRIYCAQANLGENGGNQKYCDYQVTDYITAPGGPNPNPVDGTYETNHSTGLRTPDGSTGLCWGIGAHDFYALYPSPAMLDKNGEDNVVVNSLKIEGNKVTAYLPNLQAPSAFVAPTTDTEGKKHYTIHPAMRYAYMVASATGKQLTEKVSLTFNPIITAVEMTIVNTGNAAIEGVQLVSLSSTSSTNVICGEFSVDVTNKSIVNSSTADSYKVVSVPVAETGKTIDLAPGDKITFTAFLALNANLESITATLVYANGVATKKATLTGNNGVKIVQAQKKNFITNLEANFSNAVASVELDHWMASISNISDGTTARTLASLSIPAAGGAASGHTANWDANEKYLEQELTIDELWNQGIRCFEFTVDYQSSDEAFKNQKVYCNSKPSDISLEAAVTKVKENLVNNPTEFAMVIITYQQQTGWASRSGDSGSVNSTRKPNDFMSMLNSFWNGVSSSFTGTTVENTVDGSVTITYGTALYSPKMTLNEARGKLFCIARPSSIKEDNYVSLEEKNYLVYSYIISSNKELSSLTTKPQKDILVIDGWGALKDKWEARGYTSCLFKRGTGNSVFNNALGDSRNQLNNDSKPGRPFDVASNLDGIYGTLTSTYVEDLLNNNSLAPNFYYSTTTSSATTSNAAWVQEWARVSNISDPALVTYKDGNSDVTKAVWWPSSVQEKQTRIIETLDYALNNKINGTSVNNVIFINSLCGFYIDFTLPDSYFPNSLTENSIAKQGWGYELSPLTAASSYAGMCGNISDYAYDINNYFYNYLLTQNLGGKSTGIIMMDRVSDDATANPAGYYIPRIILANNPFAVGAITDPASVPVLDEIFEPNTDMPTSPKSQENKISVSWD